MMDEKRPPKTTRDNSPCAFCQERFIACSDRCPKDLRGDYGHKAWKADLAAIKKKRKEFLEVWSEDMRRRMSDG